MINGNVCRPAKREAKLLLIYAFYHRSTDRLQIWNFLALESRLWLTFDIQWTLQMFRTVRKI